MPAFRNINLTLCSNLGLLPLEEFYPPPSLTDAAVARASPTTPSPRSTSDTPDHTPTAHPQSVPSTDIKDNPARTVSVFVQTLPCAQFWLRWRAIAHPEEEVKFYFFKLLVDGKEVVSWGGGQEDGWYGKTVFGLFEGTTETTGGGGTEKRALCFGSNRGAMGKDRVLEIRAFRAKGRKRVDKEVEVLKKTEAGKIEKGGIELINAGPARQEHPKRFYKYALMDPVDEPHATFKFYYRSEEQLRELGLIVDPEEYAEEDFDSDQASTISGCESFVSSYENSYMTLPVGQRQDVSLVDEDEDETRSQSTQDGYHTAESIISDTDSDDTVVEEPLTASTVNTRASPMDPGMRDRTSAMFKRLSFPPTTRLQPSRSGTRSVSPQKYRPLPPLPPEAEIDMQRLAIRSPSPRKSSNSTYSDSMVGEEPVADKKGGSGSLRKAFSKAMGRIRSPSPDKAWRKGR